MWIPSRGRCHCHVLQLLGLRWHKSLSQRDRSGEDGLDLSSPLLNTCSNSHSHDKQQQQFQLGYITFYSSQSTWIHVYSILSQHLIHNQSPSSIITQNKTPQNFNIYNPSPSFTSLTSLHRFLSTIPSLYPGQGQFPSPLIYSFQKQQQQQKNNNINQTSVVNPPPKHKLFKISSDQSRQALRGKKKIRSNTISTQTFPC